MDHSEDVARLFSWIKAPMVHYREFSPEVERSEAVATWPAVHMAAVQTGLASPEEATPHGDYLAHQRIARQRRGLGELAAKAIREAPLPGTVAVPEANAPHAMPSSDRLVAALGQRVQAANAERAETGFRPSPAEPVIPAAPATGPLPGAASPSGFGAASQGPAPAMTRSPGEPGMSGFDEPVATPVEAPPRGMRLQQSPARETPAPPSTAYAPPRAAEARGGLFHGEYRGRERAVRPAARVADRQDRSLGAVFDRLGGQRERLPDPRARGRTSPGLGSVFSRLR